MQPKCCVCNKELEDWRGNIMISEHAFSVKEIPDIRVMCKSCTRDLDDKGVGQKWHNFWELLWLKEHTIRYLGQVIADLVDDNPTWKWGKPAVEEIYSLAAMAHPELSQDATEQWLIDTGQA
jgi:hypothetical protein